MKFRSIAITAAIVIVAAAAGVAGFEMLFRYKLKRDTVAQAFSTLVVYSEDTQSIKRAQIVHSQAELYLPPTAELAKPAPHIGHYDPDRTVHLWILDAANKPVVTSTFRINNLGFLSGKEYSLKRAPGEYRVAVLGDSFTGARTMRVNWVDRTQDILDGDAALKTALGVRHIKVYNLGEPGAGFGHFAANYFNQGKPFDPDLVVVNYIESDYHRAFTAPAARPGPDETKTYGTGWLVYRAAPGDALEAKVYAVCARPPFTLRNQSCQPQSFLIMPEALARDPKKLTAIRQRIADDYFAETIGNSLFPYGLMRAFGTPVTFAAIRSGEIDRRFWRSVHAALDGIGAGWLIGEAKAAEGALDNIRTYAGTPEDAARALKTILDDHSRVIVTLNPAFWDMFPKRDPYDKTATLKRLVPDADIVEMRDRLPIPADEAAFKAWFNLPYDGHMSDIGGKQYAIGMACLIRERVMVGAAGACPYR